MASTEFLADGPVGDDRPEEETLTPQGIALKLALFATLLVGALAVLYYVSEHARPIYSNLMDRARLVNEEGERFEAIAVGPSHTSSIDFPALELDGLYLWRGGMDYYQVNYILQTVKDKAPNVRFVFIPASIASYGNNFLAEPGEGRRRETYVFGQRVQGLDYFRFIRDDLPEETDWKVMLQARFWPISRPDSWEGVYERILKPSIPAYTRTDSGTTLYLERRRRERITADSVAANADEVSAVQLERRSELLEAKPDMCELGQTLMDRIANALGPDVITVFFSHPAHPVYVDRFVEANQPPSVFAECTPSHYAEVLDRERENVIYIDLRYYDPISSKPSRYYANGDHFNRAGARVFSAELRARVAERLQEEFPRDHPARKAFFSEERTALSPNDTAIGQDALVRAGGRGGKVGD